MKYSLTMTVCVLGLTVAGANAGFTAYNSYQDFIGAANGFGIIIDKELNWEGFAMGDPTVNGVEYAADGLTHDVFVTVVDDVGDQSNPNDLTNPGLPGTGGRQFSRGLGMVLPESQGDNVQFGLAVPALAFGMWIIDSDIDTPGDNIVVEFITGQGGFTQTYPLQAGPVVKGGTRTNVVFFGVVVDPLQLPAERIIGMKMNEVADLDNVSIGAVTYGSEVPEPATLGLLGLGAVATVLRRRRRK